MEDLSETILDNITDIKTLKQKRKEIDPILNEVKTFFKDNKIILYGGIGMNFYLPKKYQFYDNEIDIPDYDGYSDKAKINAIKLFEILKKKEYNFLMVKNALHGGTYKIGWEFKDIGDITQINNLEYKTILKTSIFENNFYIANINLLKSNSYIELCMPKSSLFRWKKVFTRINLLETTNPCKIPKTFKSKNLFSLDKSLPCIFIDILNNIKTFILNNHIPLVGNIAVKHYLKLDDNVLLNLNKHFRYIQVLSIDVHKIIKQVINIISKYPQVEYTVTNKLNNSNLIQGKISIDIFYNNKKYKLFSAFDTKNKCISITESKSGYIYGSIFFLLHIYYYYIFLYSNDKNDKLKYIINNLLKVVNKSNFTTDCYGFNESLSVVKKYRFINKIPVVLKAA